MTAATTSTPSTTSSTPGGIADETSIITEPMQRQYEDEGYCILENVVPDEMLTMLREECSYFMGYKDAQMDLSGQASQGITHKRQRYFISKQYRMSPRLPKFIYSDLMAQITAALLGPQVYLFNEQWVVKGAEKGMKFAWHQDSGYVLNGDAQATHKPYLSCWLALDDVDESNGTIYILPHSKAGTKHEVKNHARQQNTNDLVGYSGEEQGVPVRVPAGSIACFSSYTFHCSGSNTTPNMRRTYLTQYSSEPVYGSSGKLWGMAVPFIKNGQVVYDPATDTPEHQGERA